MEHRHDPRRPGRRRHRDSHRHPAPSSPGEAGAGGLGAHAPIRRQRRPRGHWRPGAGRPAAARLAGLAHGGRFAAGAGAGRVALSARTGRGRHRAHGRGALRFWCAFAHGAGAAGEPETAGKRTAVGAWRLSAVGARALQAPVRRRCRGRRRGAGAAGAAGHPRQHAADLARGGGGGAGAAPAAAYALLSSGLAFSAEREGPPAEPDGGAVLPAGAFRDSGRGIAGGGAAFRCATRRDGAGLLRRRWRQDAGAGGDDGGRRAHRGA